MGVFLISLGLEGPCFEFQFWMMISWLFSLENSLVVFSLTLVILFNDSWKSGSRSFPFSYLNVAMLDLWQGQLKETHLVSNVSFCLQIFSFFGEKDNGKREVRNLLLSCINRRVWMIISECCWVEATNPISCRMIKPGIFSLEKFVLFSRCLD